MTYNPHKSRPPLAYTLVRKTTKDLNERLEAIITRASYLNALGAMIALVEDAAEVELATCFHSSDGSLSIILTNPPAIAMRRALTEIETACGHNLVFSARPVEGFKTEHKARANHPQGGPFEVVIFAADPVAIADRLALAEVAA